MLLLDPDRAANRRAIAVCDRILEWARSELIEFLDAGDFLRLQGERVRLQRFCDDVVISIGPSIRRLDFECVD